LPAFESPNFPLLPNAAALRAQIESQGLGQVTGLNLFSYSSCTPAIQVTLQGGARRKVVVRGAQQNDLEWSPAKAISLEKEIRTLHRLRAGGLNVPEVLSGAAPLSVPGRDSRTNRSRPFRFYVMGFVPGTAVDRRIRHSKQTEQIYYISRIAAIYARLHRTVGPGFGIMDAAGQPASHFLADTFERFLPANFEEKCAIVCAHADADIGAAVRHWAANRVPRVLEFLASSGYQAKPCLVLYDGSAGNMLVSGRRIGVIDIALTGYFDPTMEFCSFFHALRDILLENYRDGSIWDLFADRYRDAGGTLPPDRVLWALIHLGQMILQLHNLVYNATHHNPARRNRLREVAGAIGRLVEIDNPTSHRLAAALS